MILTSAAVIQAQQEIDAAQWNYDHDTDIDDRRWDYEALLRARYRLAEAVALLPKLPTE